MVIVVTKKRLGVILTILVILVGIIFVAMYISRHESSVIDGYAMGSAVTMKYSGISEDVARESLSKASDDEGLISRNVAKTEIWNINADSTGEVSDRTKEILLVALDVCEKSGGALDITMGAVTDYWEESAENDVLPDNDELTSLLSAGSYRDVEIEGNEVRIPEGMKLDLGSVGKGAACDSILSCAKENGATGCIVTVGGSVGMFGKNPSNKKGWTVGIRNPEGGTSDIIGTITLTEGFVSTSGGYEKYYTIGGKKYHHILSNTDGYPADTDLTQVTVIADSGLLSDALSTACFSLGYEKGVKLLEEYGCDGIFVTSGGEIEIVGDVIFDYYE